MSQELQQKIVTAINHDKKTKQNLLLLEKGIDGEKIHSSKGAREGCNRCPKIRAKQKKPLGLF
jgi:hypothetical protein